MPGNAVCIDICCRATSENLGIEPVSFHNTQLIHDSNHVSVALTTNHNGHNESVHLQLYDALFVMEVRNILCFFGFKREQNVLSLCVMHPNV